MVMSFAENTLKGCGVAVERDPCDELLAESFPEDKVARLTR